MNKSIWKMKCRELIIIVLLIFSAIMANSSFAVEVYLRADVTTKTMPDGKSIVMWGFAQDSAFNALNGAVTVPGPVLTVPVGDNNLTIHLQNKLTEAKTGIPGGVPVSIMVPGQYTNMTPVNFGATPYPEYAGRVRSLTQETSPGNITPVNYVYTNFKAGTYLYHSATQIQVQVQMGLYGAVKKDFAVNEAYQGIQYDNEAIILYSEIDDTLHNAVAANNYGPGKAVTSTIDYKPQYFLINGQAFSGNPLNPLTSAILKAPININQKVLLRFLNAGLKSHVAELMSDVYMNLIAEDGKPYPYVKIQYSAFLPAIKTVDAVWTPKKAGFYPLIDRMLSMTNGPRSQGGMFTTLQVSPDIPLSADQDGNWHIDDFELLDAIDCWADVSKCGWNGGNQINDFELLGLINFWACPAGYEAVPGGTYRSKCAN